MGYRGYYVFKYKTLYITMYNRSDKGVLPFLRSVRKAVKDGYWCDMKARMAEIFCLFEDKHYQSKVKQAIADRFGWSVTEVMASYACPFGDQSQTYSELFGLWKVYLVDDCEGRLKLAAYTVTKAYKQVTAHCTPLFSATSQVHPPPPPGLPQVCIEVLELPAGGPLTHKTRFGVYSSRAPEQGA